MKYTTKVGVTILQYLIEDVVCQPPGSPIRLALAEEGVDHVSTLLILTEQDINTLVYTSDGKQLKLQKGAKGLIRLLIAYIRKLQNDDGFNLLDDYRKLDRNGFEFYRLNTPITPSAFPSPMKSPPPFKSPAPLMPSERQNAIELFRRTIKRDPSQFPTLKDEKKNDS
jgi:hypothetical protein